MVGVPLRKITGAHLPMLKVFPFFASGIYVGTTFEWPNQTIGLFIFAFLLFIVMLIFRKKTVLISLMLYALFFIAGMLMISKSQIHPTNLLQEEHSFLASIQERPQAREKGYRMQLRLLGYYQQGKINPLNREVVGFVEGRPEGFEKLRIGDRIAIRTRLNPIAEPFNPMQFNYRRYLASRGIYQHFYTDSRSVVLLPSVQEFDLRSIFAQWQEEFAHRFKLLLPDKESFQVLSAMTFGFREDMSASLIEVFSETGTIHVLSVSGMHVALFYIFLIKLLGWFDRFKYGRAIRIGITLLLVWSYALLCGMESPVLRASIMISFHLWSIWKHRNWISLNGLFASAMLILCLNPHQLFDVGFQLSYFAVLGIMLLYPLMKKVYYPKHKLGAGLLDLLYVSIAAQIFSTPLVLYYFHQFPTYFLMANLWIALPSGLLLYGGLILMLFPLKSLAWLMQQLVFWTFKGLEWISTLPFATLMGIHFPVWMLFISYFTLLVFILAYRFRNRFMLFITFSLCLLVFGALSLQKWNNLHYEGVYLHNVQRGIAIAHIYRGSVQIFGSFDNLQNKNIKYSVLPSIRRFMKGSAPTYFDLKEFGSENKILVLAEGLRLAIVGKAMKQLPESQLILLRNNVSLPQELPVSYYILDGSNSWSYIKKMGDLLADRGLKSYILKDNFAYVWNR